MDNAMNERNLSTVPGGSVSSKPDLEPESSDVGANEIIPRPLPSSQEVPGFTLDDVIEVMRHRRSFVLAGVVFGVLIAALMLLLIPPLYAVSARVVITQQAPGKLIDDDSGSATFIATQAEVIQSPTVVQVAVAALPRPTYLEPEDDAVIEALDAVHATAITGTRVIALGYLGPDTNYGAALLTAMVDAYVSKVRSTTRSSQTQSLDTKAAELEELLEEIDQRESRIKEQRQLNGIIGTANEAAAAQSDRLSDHVVELMKVRNRRIELESRLETGGGRLDVDDPVRRSLREDLRLAESELAKARISLTWQHPTVVAAERNVKVLREQLASTSAYSSPDVLRQQIDEATRLQAELTAIEAQSRERLEVIESHRRDENRSLIKLERMRSQAEDWGREISDQRLVARLAQTGDVGIGARIIAKPVVPEEPVWPQPKITLASGAFCGLALGFVFGLTSLRRQRRLAEVER
jgi:uncharacterized protein involved in exopolysaccharide biosynthesis